MKPSLNFAPFPERMAAIRKATSGGKHGLDDDALRLLASISAMVGPDPEGVVWHNGEGLTVNLKPIASATGMNVSRVRKTFAEWADRGFTVEANQ